MAGTFRRDRHQYLLAPVGNAMAMTTSSTPTEPPASALNGLGVDGQRFLRAAYSDYDHVSQLEAEVLRVAAQTVDDAAQARCRGDVRAAQAAARLFAGLLARLGLPVRDWP